MAHVRVGDGLGERKELSHIVTQGPRLREVSSTPGMSPFAKAKDQTHWSHADTGDTTVLVRVSMFLPLTSH